MTATKPMQPISEVIAESGWVRTAARLAHEAQVRMDALAAEGREFVPAHRNAHYDDPATVLKRRRENAVPPDKQGMTFDTFSVGTNSHREAADEMLKWSERPYGTVYLYGSPGSGKTHLACATALRIAETGARVRFWRTVDLSRALRDCNNERAEAGALETLVRGLMNVRLLVLDDFPPEKMSEFLYEQYYAVLDYRYTTMAPTIITSNIPIEDLGFPRLVSRLGDDRVTTLLPLYGDDYRTLPSRPVVRPLRVPPLPTVDTTATCEACGGSGFRRVNLPVGHRDFGRVWTCPDCNGGILEPLRNGNETKGNGA